MTKGARKKIAIIGGGISGLGAAYLLHPHHNITVYEKNDYVGGHSRTVEVPTLHGSIPVDTGFIVFNHRNYPLLSSLFSHLNVAVKESDMSFGVSIRNGWLEYSTRQARRNIIFSQKVNLFRPQFWRMIFDILKFNRKARFYLESSSSLTLGQCLDELRMGKWFREYFLLAIGSAIWSTPLSKMLEFPALTFIRFFDNHGLLTIKDQPKWYTVDGGSREYVKRLTASFSKRILVNCGVEKVSRQTKGIVLKDARGKTSHFDEVIFACHADQALDLIDKPTKDERAVLGNLHYQSNHILLHSDVSFMPKRKTAWASWVYLLDQHKDENPNVALSYWMNNLQPLKTNVPIIVTLNPTREPQKKLVYDEHWFDHPVFDKAAINAQKKMLIIQGTNRFWFCGAYQRYGFHEDGLYSAVAMAEKMGIKPSWT